MVHVDKLRRTTGAVLGVLTPFLVHAQTNASNASSQSKSDYNPAYAQEATNVLVNSSLTFTPDNGNYSFTLYGRNLTNTIYKTALGNSNPSGGPADPSYAFYVNDPRTYGVIFRVKL